MFLPNSHSFLLVRSVISKPVIRSDIEATSTSLSQCKSVLDPDLKSGLFSSLLNFVRKIFLPNSHSFLISKSVISKPVIRSDIEEFPTSLSQRTSVLDPDLESGPSSSLLNSERKILLPNSHSFLISKSVISKPVIRSDIEESSTNLSQFTSVLDPDLESGPSSSLLSSDKSTIDDKNKRAFLKVAGIAGAGLVGSLLLPKQADAFIVGSSPTTGVVGVKDSANARINPATEETLDSLLKPTDLTFDAGALQVKVTSVSGAGSSSFSDSAEVAKSGLVDADRHLQVDVLTSALPTAASTEATLQTISFGGFKFALRIETVGSIDYIGEAAIGTATSAPSWRIKRIDSTTGIVIQWAGTGVFDQVWDNFASLDYS